MTPNDNLSPDSSAPSSVRLAQEWKEGAPFAALQKKPFIRAAHLVLLISFLIQAFTAGVLRDQDKLLPADGKLYLSYGHHLVDDGQFVQTARPGQFLIPAPGFPLMLAALYAVFGNHDIVAAALLNLLLLQLTALLVFYFLIRHNIPPGWALVGQILIAWHPGLMMYGSTVLTESPFILISTLMIFAFYEYLENGSRQKLIIFAASWGASIVIRPHWLFLGLLLAPALLLLRKTEWRLVALLQAAVWAVAAIIIGINYQIHGTVFPIVSYGGLGLYAGNNPLTRPWETYRSTNDQVDSDFLATAYAHPPKEQNLIFQQKAIEYIQAEPLLFIYRTMVKFIVFWKPVRNADNVYEFVPAAIEKLLVSIWQYADFMISLLFWLTLILITAKHLVTLDTIILLVLLIYYSALVSLNVNVDNARYRMPLMPVQVSFGLYWLWRLKAGSSAGASEEIIRTKGTTRLQKLCDNIQN